MAESSSYRLRVRYVKEGRLAFLGHLEVLRTIDRSVRRAGLPFAVGNGFARHMKIQFCQALPVGAASEAEYFDLRLTEAWEPERALDSLAAATPRDLRPVRCAYVDPRQSALEAWLDRQSWEARLEASLGPSANELADAIGSLASDGELHFMRGTKPRVVRLDETLVGYEAELGDGELLLRLETRSSERGALRPQILLDAALARLGKEPTYARVRRVAQWHAAGAALVEPFETSGHVPLT